MKYPWLIFLFFVLSACGDKTSKVSKRMVRLSPEQTGIAFVNALKPGPDLNIIEYLYYYNGGGVAAGDINNDGLIDLYFTANQTQDQLYLNKGNLKFENITKQSGISIPDAAWSSGVVMADINGDGWKDIYVCKVGNYKSLKGHNLLFINNQDNTFSEVSEKVGLDFSGFSTQASFFDYDRDGDLDMYLMNHAVHTTRSYQAASTRAEFDPLAGDRLFENRLNEGKLYFEDVSEKAGIYSSAQGYGLGLVTTDINQDGWVDIYVGNDFHEDDYLYLNQTDGTFKEVRQDVINHTSRFTMGVDVADINGDTHLDIFSLDMLPKDQQILMKSGGEDNNKVTEVKLKFGYGHQYARNAFQLNTGDGHFSEVALLTDTYATDWSWSVLLQDYDNDGLTDIFITNGIYKRPNDLDYINFLSNTNLGQFAAEKQDSVELELIERMPTLKIPNYLYENKGNLQFKEVSKEWGLDEPSYSNGAVYADLDNDGDLELVINNINSEAFVYKNTSSDGHSIQLELVGDSLNKNAIGAKVKAWYGEQVAVREITSSRGFQSSPSDRVHFGLGRNTRVDSLLIQWPDGSIQRVHSLQAGVIHKVEKDASSGDFRKANSADPQKYLEFDLSENNYKDYDKEILIPEKLSTEGPAVVAADFNGDGSDDLFIGTARGQINQLFLSTAEGLVKKEVPIFDEFETMEAVGAISFDLEGDGDPDIYVVHGGNDYPYESPFFEDVVYVNDGQANFTKAPFKLPDINGSCVAAGDYDKDGDTDLFVGGRAVPGGYGLSPYSFLLENKEGTLEIAKTWQQGMVTDAVWHDYDEDGLDDLFIVGDWMPVTVLKNKGNAEFKDETESLGLDRSQGMWNHITLADVNADGKADMIVGNLGLNSKFQASPTQPVTLYLDDFDQNAQPDPLIFYFKNGENIPFASRNELTGQLPSLKKAFLSYEDFSRVRSIKDLTGQSEEEVEQINHIYDLSSGVFLYEQGKFVKRDFPLRAQFSPVNDVLVLDLDEDGFQDLVYVGNFFGSVTSVGRYDASPGGILGGHEDGTFEFVSYLPLDFEKEYRKVISLNDTFVIIPSSGKPILLEKNRLIELFRSRTDSDI